MKGNDNNYFGYSEKNVGRTVQNVTSDMWEPISTGSPAKKSAPSQRSSQPQKDTPVRKSPAQNKKSGTQNKSASSSKSKSPDRKKQTKKTPVDVTQDRISEGGRKPAPKKQVKPEEKKKKSAPKSKKNAVGSKKREPKGRDTRSLEQQRQKQRAKNLNKSRLEYNEQRKSGHSHDDISKDTIRRKRNKAKIIAIVTTFIVVLFVAGFIGAYAYTEGAPIAVISIEGESRYKDKKIIEAANVYAGLNMLSVREKAVNEAVTKKLPYISEVEVDYQLPDTLLLKVTATEEKYLITNGEGYICVDGKDKVVSVKKKKLTEGRYRLTGFEEQTAAAGEQYIPSENNLEKYNKAKELVAALEKVEGFSSGVIDLANLKDITYTYDSRIRIYLGEGEAPDKQLSLAMEVIKDSASEGQTGYIDMRFSDKAYLALGSMEIH